MSAHLLLLQLMRLPDRPPLRITVIERTAGNRMGDAFCSDRPYHLLNVPVARMSAYADKPDDLQRWLAGEGYNADAGAFIPRCLYREYIRRSVEEMIREKAMAIDFIHREACDIDMEERTVVLDNGETVPAGKIVYVCLDELVVGGDVGAGRIKILVLLIERFQVLLFFLLATHNNIVFHLPRYEAKDVLQFPVIFLITYMPPVVVGQRKRVGYLATKVGMEFGADDQPIVGHLQFKDAHIKYLAEICF